MVTRQIIEKALAAHGAWKQRLRAAIEAGRSDFVVAVVQVDDQCEFGKWLYGLDAVEKAHPRAMKIRALHADFHREAGRILAMALAGKKADAEAAVAPTSQFGKMSGALALELNGWMQKI